MSVSEAQLKDISKKMDVLAQLLSELISIMKPNIQLGKKEAETKAIVMPEGTKKKPAEELKK